MGFLKEKYTKEYFLSRDSVGKKLNFGALGSDDFLKGEVYNDIKKSLNLIKNYKNRNVLEIGYGRGESIKYLYQKNINSYFGVDFSQATYDIANEYILPSINNNNFKIFCDDALDFLRNNASMLKKNKINTIILLDAIEHIPVKEINEIFQIINSIVEKDCLFIAHTPFYPVDEDFVSSNKYICPTPTDLKEETRGMHCNKYTKERFIKQFSDIGFYNIKSNRLFCKTSKKAIIWKRILHFLHLI